MESSRYYQFINTIDVEEVGSAMYRVYGALDGVMLSGLYIESYGVIMISDNVSGELNEDELEEIKQIIIDKVEELKEEEKIL
jgi:hypothetical protein